MIFADKLIRLRKKAGWSQEELAARLDVSRQSVSKWESAQSIPDLEKIVRLSKLFGVTTDYLLKDEMTDEEMPKESSKESEVRYVSMQEANRFMEIKEQTSKMIAYGVFLCIISPLCLLLLGVFSESGAYGISENTAGMIGLIVLLVLVTIAVAIFIFSGSKTAKYEYLEEEVFETEYGVTGMVKERKEKFQTVYTKYNIVGVSLCILALVPFFTGAMFCESNEIILVFLLCLALVIIGIAVVLFVRVGIIHESFEKLLQEGDYTKAKKEKSPIVKAVTIVYWMVVTAVYLAVSLPSRNWREGWIIWVIAAVLFPALIVIIHLFDKKKDS